MLPHTSILSIPPTKKHRRRTIQVAPHSPRYEVHVRELNINQAGLGCAVWDGAILLARYLHYLQHTSRTFTDTFVLELGAGVALPSLTVGRHCARVVASDYEEDLVDNAQYNLRLNASANDEDDDETRAMKSQLRGSFATALLDWSLVPDDAEDDGSEYNDPIPSGRHSMDYIIGAEIMYTHSQRHSDILTRACNYYLRPTGRLVLVHSENREGTSEWITRLTTEHHYHCIVTPITEVHCPWLVGMRLGGEKKVTGFQQRDERYYLYELTRYPSQESQPSPAIVGQLPNVRYALDEEVIRASAVESGDVDGAAAVMASVMAQALKLDAMGTEQSQQ